MRPFNPLPSHEGRRHGQRQTACGRTPFNPLPSHEGRLPQTALEKAIDAFQSTSLSRGKTIIYTIYTYSLCLSIHFPLTREDFSECGRYQRTDLSIHFPLTREDKEKRIGNDNCKSFNPLPSHEGRRNVDVHRLHNVILSIHFPLTREDRKKR